MKLVQYIISFTKHTPHTAPYHSQIRGPPICVAIFNVLRFNNNFISCAFVYVCVCVYVNDSGVFGGWLLNASVTQIIVLFYSLPVCYILLTPFSLFSHYFILAHFHVLTQSKYQTETVWLCSYNMNKWISSTLFIVACDHCLFHLYFLL